VGPGRGWPARAVEHDKGPPTEAAPFNVLVLGADSDLDLVD
jgi:hypothetical protein